MRLLRVGMYCADLPSVETDDVIDSAHVRDARAQPGLTARHRDGGKVRTRTLANLSRWPEAKIEAWRRVLKGEAPGPAPDQLTIERSLPHGHLAAMLGLARKLGLDRLLPQRPQRLARLALALVVARVLEPAAKLATARQLSAASAAHSLGAVLGLGAVDEDELYRALDLLGEAQPRIEAALGRRSRTAAWFCTT